MSTEQTAPATAETTSTPAAAQPQADAKAADAKPPSRAAETKPESAEERALKAEALKTARENRELKTKLAALEKRIADEDKTAAEREAQRRELEALKTRDPRTWLQRAAGEDPAAFAKRLAGDTKEAQLERTVGELREELKAALERCTQQTEAERARQIEAAQANAYRAVLSVAESAEDLSLAAEEIKANPTGARKWIAQWAEESWPEYAREHGLDVSDANACARSAAKVLDERALARLSKLAQNAAIAKRLGFAVQSSQPPASPGNPPPRTITSADAGTRSAAPAPAGEVKLTPAQQDREARRRALELGHRLAAEKAAEARSRG